MIARRAAVGALAGAVGTAALGLTLPLERALVGGEPPFTPRAIAAGALRRLGLRASRDGTARLGQALRWLYGPALGIAHALVAPRRARSQRGAAIGALAFAGAILGFELAALPLLVGRRGLYRPRTLAALALHVAAFTAIAVPVERALSR